MGSQELLYTSLLDKREIRIDMFRIVCLIIGYFFGCISTAYIVGKVRKVDIRSQGSGNLGATNTVRALGFKMGVVTFFGDALKTTAAFFVCKFLFQDNAIVAAFYGAAGAILGHDFPFYLNFKGGKGVACSVGMMFGALPFPAIPVFGIIIAILMCGYVSLMSLIFSLIIPISLYLTNYPMEVVVITLLLSALAFFQHRENIKKLINGTEHRFDILSKLKLHKKE